MSVNNSDPEPPAHSRAALDANGAGSGPSASGTQPAGSQTTGSAPRAPDLPGITAGRFLGNTRTSGRDGVTSVWLGLDEQTGARVVIRVVPGAAEVAVLGLSDEHLVTTVAVHQLGADRHAHVAEHHRAGSLESLVQRQGRLGAQQTLGVMIAVSSGLADIHAAGLAHGAVGPAQVVLNAQGRPLLGGLECVRAASETPVETQQPRNQQPSTGPPAGRMTLADESRPATKTSDVAALGSLGWFALTGRPAPAGGVLTGLGDVAPHVPAAMVSAILDCQLNAGGAEKSQPTAAAVAARLRALGTGESIELPADSGPGATRVGRTGASSMDVRNGSSPRSPDKVAAMAVAAARSRHGATRPWRARVVQATGVAILASVVGAGGWAIATSEDAPPASPVAASPTAAGQSTVDPTPTATASATRPPPPSPTAAPPTEGDSLLDTTRSADPVQALHALNELRVQALSTEDATLLATVNAPDSPALRHDQDVAKQLVDEKIDVRGLGVRLLWTTVLDETDHAARIQLSSQVEGHRQITDGGAATSASTHGVDAGETRTLTMELVRLAGQWRIYAVREPGSIPTSGPFAVKTPSAPPTP